MTLSQKRILHIDDHPLFCRAIAQLVLSASFNATVFSCNTYHHGIESIWADRWDLIILDVSLGGRTGVDLLREIRSHDKSVPVIVLTMYPEQHLAVRMFRLGATGYVCKSADSQTMLDAIGSALAGKKFITPTVAELLATQVAGDTTKTPHERLSHREFVVFQYIATGRSIKDIGAELNLSIKTVSTYRARILAKMGIQSNADITRYCMENNLLPAD